MTFAELLAWGRIEGPGCESQAYRPQPIILQSNSPLAQSVERLGDIEKAVGSKPTWATAPKLTTRLNDRAAIADLMKRVATNDAQIVLRPVPRDRTDTR